MLHMVFYTFSIWENYLESYVQKEKGLHEANSFSPMTTIQIMASLLCWEEIRTLDQSMKSEWPMTEKHQGFLSSSASGLHSRGEWSKNQSRVFKGAKNPSMVLPFKLERLQSLVPSYFFRFWYNSIKLGYLGWVLSVTRIDRIFILGECGPLDKGMANHFSILALKTPWAVWKGKMIGYWKRNSPGQ